MGQSTSFNTLGPAHSPHTKRQVTLDEDEASCTVRTLRESGRIVQTPGILKYSKQDDCILPLGFARWACLTLGGISKMEGVPFGSL